MRAYEREQTSMDGKEGKVKNDEKESWKEHLKLKL